MSTAVHMDAIPSYKSSLITQLHQRNLHQSEFFRQLISQRKYER